MPLIGMAAVVGLNAPVEAATIAVVGAVALVTIVEALRTRSAVVRPVRSLASRARAVASGELAAAIDSLENSRDGAHRPQLVPFDEPRHEELAELASAMTALQDAAVEIALEQHTARRALADQLVTLAQKQQALLGRAQDAVSSIERDVEDDEATDRLRQLDHLAVMMRRNAHSLKVLSGVEPSRPASPPVQIGDVVRMALGQLEHPGQVELADLGDAAFDGPVVPDVSLVLAELIENATNFSSPATSVTVVGRPVPDGHQLAIFDYGAGMTSEELSTANARLNHELGAEADLGGTVGFAVVARLADRHGMKVMLTTTPGGRGTTAIVRLPSSLLRQVSSPAQSVMAELPAVFEQLAAPLPVTAGGSDSPLATAEFIGLVSDLAKLEASVAAGGSPDDPWAAVALPVPPLALSPVPDVAFVAANSDAQSDIVPPPTAALITGELRMPTLPPLPRLPTLPETLRGGHTASAGD
ncbi:MAG TPA: ATP-binding protein [Ilumatobacteraceae bacterium]|nr:ATP-binding protein [Ilumatobacteraceae bacterium]